MRHWAFVAAHHLNSGSDDWRLSDQGSGIKTWVPFPCQWEVSPSIKPMNTFWALLMLTWYRSWRSDLIPSIRMPFVDSIRKLLAGPKYTCLATRIYHPKNDRTRQQVGGELNHVEQSLCDAQQTYYVSRNQGRRNCSNRPPQQLLGTSNLITSHAVWSVEIGIKTLLLVECDSETSSLLKPGWSNMASTVLK